ncbi:hypothetical protein STRDD11_00967 [Streptococcus sp. DD11]|uniref:GNAT family N-acetyltransferase n=1 Tax=Streptococcus sp. DD11 TaxID=1777879 RepID=UPI000794F6BE|nr:GNAT family N-acetyltransferase [Streptococcus sp. DD11]KXT84467.1 hypothetical protein STRDD11_00967 [Streptococcus sp. DD11]
MVKIRKAAESDRKTIASTIVTAYDNDFSAFVKQFGREFVLDFMEQVLQIKYFYVAEQAGQIIGILAISDANGRATKLDRQQLAERFGRIKVFFLSLGFSDFEKPGKIPATTGYIEYVAVAAAYRGQGLGRQMLKESMKLAGFKDYILDVKDSNEAAIRCYQKLGFREFARKKKPFLNPLKDFKEFIWMERLADRKA